MRHYDSLSGRRFDMNHPRWPVKKDGTPYLRLAGNAMKKLEGRVKLVPGVTDLCGPLKSVRLLNWTFAIGVELGWDGARQGFSLDDCKAWAESRRWEAADKGSEIHEILEDPASALFRACREMVADRVGLDISEGDNEIQFATDEFGGTADRVGPDYVLDWKSSGKVRSPYLSELAQMCAYNQHFKRTRLVNVYISQETLMPYRVVEWSCELQEIGLKVFNGCLEQYRNEQAFKAAMKGGGM